MRYVLLALLVVVLGVGVYFYLNRDVYPNKPPSPIVTIPAGQLRGVLSISREGRTYNEFAGIPYAKPPIGELRYEPPQNPEPWVGLLSLTRYAEECPQWNGVKNQFIGDEDCLVLNVFTPNLTPKKPLPVMIFIHGGLFMFGSSNMYRPTYLMDHDIVVVSINYRLSSFGFLNTGDSLVRGNMGLKDQVKSIKWVNTNIRYFGGDPNKVTLFGESAGGASVHLHLLSPKTKGLFHSAILQSGVSLNQWVMKPNPREQYFRFASHVGCIRNSSAEIVKCLKNTSATKILESHMDSKEIFREPISLFGPTVETVWHHDAYLSKHPSVLIPSGRFHRVPIIVGYNSQEGLLSAPEIVKNSSALKYFHEHYYDVMPNFIFYPRKGAEAADDMEAIRNYYFGPNERLDSAAKLENFTNLFTDWVWGVGIDRTLKHHAYYSSEVYGYYYSYKGEFQLANLLLAVRGVFPPSVEIGLSQCKEYIQTKILRMERTHYGACHGDEIPLLFKIPIISNIVADHPDYEMSKEFVNLWVSFAQKQPVLKFKNKTWSKVGKKLDTVKFLQIDKEPAIIENPNHERIQFLAKFHP